MWTTRSHQWFQIQSLGVRVPTEIAQWLHPVWFIPINCINQSAQPLWGHIYKHAKPPDKSSDPLVKIEQVQSSPGGRHSSEFGLAINMSLTPMYPLTNVVCKLSLIVKPIIIAIYNINTSFHFRSGFGQSQSASSIITTIHHQLVSLFIIAPP